jgi:hypothetical protein
MEFNKNEKVNKKAATRLAQAGIISRKGADKICTEEAMALIGWAMLCQVAEMVVSLSELWKELFKNSGLDGFRQQGQWMCGDGGDESCASDENQCQTPDGNIGVRNYGDFGQASKPRLFKTDYLNLVRQVRYWAKARETKKAEYGLPKISKAYPSSEQHVLKPYNSYGRDLKNIAGGGYSGLRVRLPKKSTKLWLGSTDLSSGRNNSSYKSLESYVNNYKEVIGE